MKGLKQQPSKHSANAGWMLAHRLFKCLVFAGNKVGEIDQRKKERIEKQQSNSFKKGQFYQTND